MYFLRLKLRALRKAGNPSREFTARLLSELEPVTSYRRHAFRLASVGMASFVLLFGTGTGVYAYQSPAVADGHPLYTVKRGIELMEERFATTPEKRADFHAKMMERRVREAERLDSAHEIIPRILRSAERELDLTVTEMGSDSRPPAMRMKMIERLSQANDRYERVRSRVSDDKNFPPPSAEHMRERLRTLRPPLQETEDSE